MKVIAIASPKGGNSKTTTSVSLAAFLGQKHKTLLVDCDPQGHCARSFGIDPNSIEQSLYEVLFGQVELADAIRPMRDQLDLLPSNRNLAIGELELRDELRREEKLNALLAPLDYEFIIIDCPPALGLLSVNALLAATHIIIPVHTWLGYEAKAELVTMLVRLKQNFPYKQWDVRVLQTFFRSNVKECNVLRDKLASEFGANLLESKINLNTDISNAVANGRPITDFSAATGYMDYLRLSKEIVHVTKENKAISGQRSEDKRAV